MLEPKKYGVANTDPAQQTMGVLKTLTGSGVGAQQAMDYANLLYPEVEKVDPWEAAFRFFSDMGKAASQPGSTALSAAVSSMDAPLDYLNAKKKEKTETDRARLQTALQIAPSLKPKGRGGYKAPSEYMISMPIIGADGQPTGEYETAYRDYLLPRDFAKLQEQGARFTSVDKTQSSTFRERKFFRTGFDPVVVKNPNDAARFDADPDWTSMPPENWVDSKGGTGEGTAEVQSAKILDRGVIVYAFKDGTTIVENALGKIVTGQARADAIAEAEERGIQIQTERAGGRRAATVAVNTSLSAFDQVGKSRANIANLEEARRLVAEEGANTGFLADKFPSWKNSTIALDTVKNELGLDVVGSVTFGALSQGELTLALNTALPTNLSEDKLVDWIDRKITAQRKLQNYLYGQAIYLADGDKTIGDWLRKQKADQKKSEREEAVRRQKETNFDFSVMVIKELREIDTDSLTDSEFDAWDKRMTELGF